MTPETAVRTLEQWTSHLMDLAAVELTCDMSKDEIERRLDLRQQSINRIQQLDGSLTELRRILKGEWQDLHLPSIKTLIEKGNTIIDSLQSSDKELIEIAGKKRTEILENLRRSTLSRGYFSANSAPKIHPPAILDDNA